MRFITLLFTMILFSGCANVEVSRSVEVDDDTLEKRQT